MAITLAKQRLMTALYEYYELAHPNEGVGGGFKYKTVPHITLGSIANNPDIDGIWDKHQEAIGALASQAERQRPAKIGKNGRFPGSRKSRGRKKPCGSTKIGGSIELPGSRRLTLPSHATRRRRRCTDQPLVDSGKRRVTGPFSVEAVPAPSVKPIDDVDGVDPTPADDTVGRSGETLRQSDWRDELLKNRHQGQGWTVHPLRSPGTIT